MDTQSVEYPQHWQADVVLKDGVTAHIRPIVPGDAAALERFHLGQSQESVYFRFFAPKPKLSAQDLENFTNVDHRQRVALVAVRVEAHASEHREEILGVGRFEAVSQAEAEVAFNISDRQQGRGLGSILLDHLSAAARELGYKRFVAEVLPANRKMLTVFTQAGYQVVRRFEDGIIAVEIDLDPTERSLEVLVEREHHAESTSIQRIFNSQQTLITAENLNDLPEHLHEPGPGRQVVPVSELEAYLASASSIDLVVVQGPGQNIEPHLDRLAHLGVRAIVLFGGINGVGTAGSADSVKSLRAFIQRVHSLGIRLLGPNTFGLHRTDGPELLQSKVDLNRGQVGLFCHSAESAQGLLNDFAAHHIGISTFVSAGERAGISGNDIMQFWLEDPETQVVALHLESLGNPRKFGRIIRGLARKKPVIVMTSALNQQTMPSTHLVRSSSIPPSGIRDILAQSGVIAVTNRLQMLNAVRLFAAAPPPKRGKILVAAWSETILATMRSTAVGSTLQLETILLQGEDTAALITKLQDSDITAVVISDIQVPEQRHRAAIDRVMVAARQAGKPLLFFHNPETYGARHSATHGYTFYTQPESIVQVLSQAFAYDDWKSQQVSAVRTNLGGLSQVVTMVDQLLADGVRELNSEQATDLLAHIGIELWPSHRVMTLEQALETAERIGYPVALKTQDTYLRHRADLGGVRLDIHDAEELEITFQRMTADLAKLGSSVVPGFEVQQMTDPGAGVVLHGFQDALFGPTLEFGMAGDAIDLLEDRSFQVAPLEQGEALQLIRRPRAAIRLYGYRGLPVAHTEGLADVIQRVSQLLDQVPAVSSLLLKPILVSHERLTPLHARISIAPAYRIDAGWRTLGRGGFHGRS